MHACDQSVLATFFMFVAPVNTALAGAAIPVVAPASGRVHHAGQGRA